MTDEKLTAGLNDRPKNASIGHSADGFPDDSSRPVGVNDKTIVAAKRRLSGKPSQERLKELEQQEETVRLESD
ncbi:hypothetical protein [Rhizobium sp. RCC_161_2]|uniref:hypothetical protein n=1 Tax=Rhizobium sp. RCC_161_2 TaxID=3239219 RepID=UPI00352695AB